MQIRPDLPKPFTVIYVVNKLGYKI